MWPHDIAAAVAAWLLTGVHVDLPAHLLSVVAALT